MKIRLDVKPLSVNEAYTGRRFASDKLKNYKKFLSLLIRRTILPPPPFEIIITHGQSNFAAADWDGPIKNFQDILCTRYGINDKIIYKGTVEKVPAPKGKEFIIFELRHYDPPEVNYF